MKLAAIEIDKLFCGTGAIIIFINHDSFLIEAPPDFQEDAHAIIRDAILRAGKAISPSLSLRIDQKQPWLSYWHHGQGEAALQQFVDKAEEEIAKLRTKNQAASWRLL